MLFARVTSAFDCKNPCIDQLVESSGLDTLQLDYQFPHTRVPHDESRATSFAAGFLAQIHTLHKWLYLDTALRVITNAGGHNTRGCVENLANFLCTHDSANLPITSVRGDNALAMIDALMADGHKLENIDTGQPLHELHQPLVTAQIELGAGPIKTALDEGSRVIISGCYDTTAPLIATAANSTSLNWQQFDKIAQLAVASQLDQTIVSIDEQLNIDLSPQPASDQIEQYPAHSVNTHNTQLTRYADVCVQTLPPSQQTTNHQTPTSIPVSGEAPTGNWLLRATYVKEYFAEALWRFDRSTTSLSPELVAEKLLESINLDKNQSTIESNVLSSNADPNNKFLRVRCRSQEHKQCDNFVNAVKNFAAATHDAVGPWINALPSVQCLLADFCCEVPRDAIAVSVDTRPAKEWI